MPRKIAPEFLTPFGKEIKRLITGKPFIDLGSGYKEECVFPRFMAQFFGATECICVDKFTIDAEEIRENEFPSLGAFRTSFLSSDMLSFLAQVEFQSAVFFLSGIEAIPQSSLARFEKCFDYSQAYSRAVSQELSRLAKPGDAVIIGIASDDVLRATDQWRLQIEHDTVLLSKCRIYVKI